MRNIAMLALCLMPPLLTQAATTEIPFHDCQGLICMDIALDGAKPRSLVLDTGDVSSVLMRDVAQSLQWTLEPIVQEGKTLENIQRGGEHKVAFGQMTLPGKFLVFDRKAFGDHPLPGDGSLAYTFFKDRRLQIDYVHHMLRLSDSPTDASAAALPGKLELITFGKQGPPIVVGSPFTVNNKSVRAQIDTCYTGTLLVYDAALDAHGLKKQGKPEFFPDTDGGVNMLAGTARSLGFEQRDLGGAHPTLYFVGSGDNPVHQPDALFEATVGNALFKHSIVTLDFHSMTMDVKSSG